MKPQRYYGLHMVEGLAEYREPGKDPYRIFVGEQAIKNMDASFTGLPVYVHHVDEVEFNKDLRKEADGFVVRSFYNKADGKHWAEFIIVSEEGLRAIQNGWKLSNAYKPHKMDNGGQWHGVSFDREVIAGEYEHLALVPNPRYAESVILTPEEFKAYNSTKEAELLRIANSKDDTKKGESKMFKFFKREKIENSADFENMMVELPKSKKEMTLSTLINEMDKVVNMSGYAAEDHMVKVGNEEMSVKDLVANYGARCNEIEEMKKNMAGKGEEEKKENEDEEDMDDKKENVEDEEAKKKALELAKHEEEELAAKKKNAAANHSKLKNAQSQAAEQYARVELPMDQLARGKAKYGSGK